MRVIEAFVALLVGLALVTGGWAVLAHASLTSRTLRVEGERLETRRLVGAVLDAELAGARPGLDWRADPAGLALRVFRGWGIACGAGGPGVAVAYRGLRQPDPAKDSLELVLADGAVRRVALADVEGVSADADCTAAPSALPDTVRLRWAGDLDDAAGHAPVFVRLYESGLYALTDAFRYRRGAGGRQPLGPSVLDPERSRLGVFAEAPEVVIAVPGGDEARERRWAR